MQGDEDISAEIARLGAENELLKRRAQRRSHPSKKKAPPPEPARAPGAGQPKPSRSIS